MQFSSRVLATASLLGFAAARPTSSTPARQAPTISSSKAFNLRITQTEPAALSVNDFYVGGVRVGSGTYITELGSSAGSTPYYLNETSPQMGNVVTDIPNVYPISLLLSGPTQYDYFYPKEHDVGLSPTDASLFGVYPQSTPDGLVILVGLESDNVPLGGQWAACVRPAVLGGDEENITTLRYVYAGETFPDNCAHVEIRAECATLNELPAGSTWNHDDALEVPCLATEDS
ncbi:hypothetical protein F5Y16DRAFT_368429 [Xylariaceae sp. FL0255]|nr:hypothetical protein F5Y16DRAFT_368429 [Xylariaceae sp. FL0255]